MVRVLVASALMVFIPFAAASCECSEEEYELFFGEARDFYAVGPSPYLEPWTGNVVVVEQGPVSEDVTRIRLQCSSIFGCTGAVYGC